MALGISMGIINKNYVSALDPSLDVREIDHKVYDIWREDAFTDMLQIGDRKQPTSQPFFISWTNVELFYRGKVTSATNSGTATVTIVLDAGSAGIARKGAVGYLKDGTSGIVTSVSTTTGVDTITLKTDNGTLTVAANDYVNFGGVLVGENAISPTNARFGYNKYTNKVAAFTETSKITDIQKAGKLEAEIDGQDSFIVKDHLDKLRLFKGAMNFEFLMGQISTTSYADGTPTLVDPTSNGVDGGGAMQRGRGLYQYINTYGTTLEAVGSGTGGATTPNGQVVTADMDTVCDALLANRSMGDQVVLMGSAVKRGFDKWGKNLASSGIESVRLVIGGKELDLEVDKFNYGGFTFNLATMGIMNHPNVSNTIVGKSALFLPNDYRVPVYSDGGVQNMPALGMRYIPNGSLYGNEVIGETYTGAMAPHPSGDARNWQTTWHADAALEFKAPSFGVAMQVNA